MPIDHTPDEFPPDIAAAFEAYPTPAPSRDFEAKFWSQLEAQRGRYRGWRGFLRRLWELEFEGVAVWRLAASTLSGGALCALFFGLFALSLPHAATNATPAPLIRETPRMALDARHFYAREWEEFDPAPRPKIAPQKRQKPKQGGEISCVGRKNGWV